MITTATASTTPSAFTPTSSSVLEGKTGKLLLDRHTNHDVFKETWTLYAVPAVADFLHNGATADRFTAANATVFAVLSTGGLQVAWRHGPSPGWPDVLPGIGDFDGDGALELLSAGHRLAGRPFGAGAAVLRSRDRTARVDPAPDRPDISRTMAAADDSRDGRPRRRRPG